MRELKTRIDEFKIDQLPLIFTGEILLPEEPMELLLLPGTHLAKLIHHRIQQEQQHLFGIIARAEANCNATKVAILDQGEYYAIGTAVKLASVPIAKEDGSVMLNFKAKQRFRLRGAETALKVSSEGWLQAAVEYLDDITILENDADDLESLEMARKLARELVHDNGNVSGSLVQQFIGLSREQDAHRINERLRHLGKMPTEESPSQCAFWVGALLAAHDDIVDIRPQLLMAKTAEARTQIVLHAIWNSIRYMKGPKIQQS